MRQFGAIFGVSAFVWLTACAGFGDKLRDAHVETCQKVLDDYPALSSDARYRAEERGARENYETKVATCYLELRKPEKALALVKTWQADSAIALQLSARAYAQLDRGAELRNAVQTLVMKGGVEPEFFLEAPEFRNHLGQEWFAAYAVHVWEQRRGGSLERFAEKFSRARKEGLLSLRVATADAQRAAGEWAMWVGAVRKGHIDRASRRTVLIVEGVDVKRELRMLDRKVRSIEVTGYNEITPKYDETRRYTEVFVPNGLLFVVAFPGVSEPMVRMANVSAFGRYAGRDPDENLPMLNASLVAERTPNESTEED